MKKIINIIIIIFMFCMSRYVLAAPTLQSEGAILIEAKTNTILYEKSANQRFYPASITKVLTALIVEEKLDDGSMIYKTRDSINNVPGDSSQIGIEVGDSYTKKDGLYGMMLGSDNYIAYDLAKKVSGSIPEFAILMNQKAKEAGAVNSHFVNPHGYHDPNHYTTPYDMSQIARAAFSNTMVQKIAGTRSYDFYIDNKNRFLSVTNSSRLLKSETPYYNAHVVACKTGFHDDAKQTLVAKAKYGDMELIAVAMKVNTPNQYIDVNTLFEYGSTHFSVEKVNGKYQLINKSKSNWSKFYIEAAIREGWYTESGENYQEAITVSELVSLLNEVRNNNLKITAVEVEQVTGLKSEAVITREEASQIVAYILQRGKLKKQILSNDPHIPDRAQITVSKQEAVDYTVKRGVLGSTNKAFRPNEKLTKEEAICMVYKLIH